MIPYWKDGSAEHREEMRKVIFTMEGIKQTYLTGAHDAANSPGVKDIMLDMFYDIRNDPNVFREVRKFFKDRKPPTLIVDGENDPIFTTDCAKAHHRRRHTHDQSFVA